MIPFLPGRHRRPVMDHDSHLRARTLLAARLDDELAEDDAAWLEQHLAACDECPAVGAAYAEQRDLLRSFPVPVPPRDLWARTSAKIELESRGRARGRPPRRSVVPLGALSGALVVAVVVGASLLSQPTVTPVDQSSLSPVPSSAGITPEPRSTPIAVGAGDVGWALQNDDGSYSVAFAQVDEVCGSDIASDCAPLDPPVTSSLRLDAAPRAIVKSPTQDQLVVVEADTRTSGGTVYVVPVPSPQPSAIPTLVPSLSPSPSPSAPPSPSPSSAASPTPTPTPTPSVAPTPSASPRPSPSPSAAPTPSVEPSVTPSPSPVTSTEPSVAPSPSPSGGDTTGSEPIAIAADVIVVGESAAYSSDGSWFAFSARPADGTAGPDIYVWQPGDESAHPVTTDHRSVFSAWVGDRILGSRVLPSVTEDPEGASPAPESVSPSLDGASPVPESSVSFLLDPATGEATTIAGLRIWRPVVDPTGRYVIFWDGSIEVGPNGVDWHPGAGRLVLARWDPTFVNVIAASPEPSGSPEPSISPEPSAEASAEPSPSLSPMPVATVLAVLADGVVRDWDVHWDETGTRFALWIADPVDAAVGSISLHELDPATGMLDPNGPVLAGVPALAGFSIGDGRLAWATPPGQGGEGSRIVVLAWRGDDAGRIESTPDKGSAPVVVIK